MTPTELSDPVFVLCADGSGAHLLRSVLDAHPHLGCPPDGGLPELCSHLADVWSTATGVAPAGRPEVPEDAITGVRRSVDPAIGAYLERTGTTRYCDTGTGNAPHAGLLLRLYPRARFLCLYRHPMDAIAATVGTAPWDLTGRGLESYLAATPGNLVHPVARYWSDRTAEILAVEDRHPEHCHRIRYEDLVADPESTVGAMFAFLGVPTVPVAPARWVPVDRGRGGATADPAGRGWSVPARLLRGPARTAVNELAVRLGYVQVDDGWGVRDRPADVRTDAAVAPVPPPGVRLVTERLRAGVTNADRRFAHRWRPFSAESFLVRATVPEDEGTWWRVDPIAGDGIGRAAGPDGTNWTIAAPADTWYQVIRGGITFGVAFGRCGMRYRDAHDTDAGSITAYSRIAMLADLLQVERWGAS